MSDFKKLFESQADEPSPAVEPTPPAPVVKRGRAKGKRSNPNYTQVGAYIPKDLDLAVKRKLLGTNQDFSELIAELLTKWLSD